MPNKKLPQVKKFREKMGVTQSELSELSGVSLRTIQRVELGSKASLETARALASAFSLSDYRALTSGWLSVDESESQIFRQKDEYDPEKLIKLSGWGNLLATAILLLALAIAISAIAYKAHEKGNYLTLFAVTGIFVIPFLWMAAERWLKRTDTVDHH